MCIRDSHSGDAVDLTDLLHCQLTAVTEGEQVLTLHVQFCNGSPQIFKPEIPEHCILHGTLDAIRTLSLIHICQLPALRAEVIGQSVGSDASPLSCYK